MYKPYAYQELYIENALKLVKKYGSVILCAPTGAGKTIIFALIVKRLVEEGKTVYLLVNRVNLFTQAIEKVRKMGIKIGTIASKYRYKKGMGFYVVSAQTMRNRDTFMYDYPDVIFGDETHTGDILNVMKNMYPYVPKIGLTATPIASNPRNLEKAPREFYKTIYCGTNKAQLLKDGRLCQMRTVTVNQKTIDFIKEQKNDKNDFNGGEQVRLLSKYGLLKQGFEAYLKESQRRKCIAFTPNVASSIEYAKYFNDNGVKATVIHNKMNKEERKEVMHSFEHGDVEIIFNYSILLTGYDFPPTTDVLWLRLTRSLITWEQGNGRASRVYGLKEHVNFYGTEDGFIPKTHANCIDVVGNVHLHCAWDYPRDYEDMFWNPEKYFGTRKKNGVAPTKQCPKCESFLHTTVKKCTYCGYKYPEKKVRTFKGAFELEEVSTNKVFSTGNKALETMHKNVLLGRSKHYLFDSAFKYHYINAESFLLQKGYKIQDFEQYKRKWKYYGYDKNGKNNVIILLKKENNNYIAKLYSTRFNKLKDLKPSKTLTDALNDAMKCIKPSVNDILYHTNNKNIKNDLKKAGLRVVERISKQLERSF